MFPVFAGRAALPFPYGIRASPKLIVISLMHGVFLLLKQSWDAVSYGGEGEGVTRRLK